MPLLKRIAHCVTGHSFRVQRVRRVGHVYVLGPFGMRDGGIYERLLRCECGCEQYRNSVGWMDRGQLVLVFGEHEDVAG